MIAYLIRRVLWGFTLLVVISFSTFAIFFVVPQDRTELGRGFSSVDINLREAASLNSTPLPAQWAQYMWNAVRHQSLGRSFRSQEDVADIIMRALPVTISLVVGGVVLFLLVAIPIGILSAVRSRSVLDRFFMIAVLIGISAHPMWIGLMLSYLFGYKWGLTPITGYCDLVNPSTGTGCGGFVDWSYHLVLPWITFAILFAALYVRMIRASVLESLDEDYVRTARAKGGSGLYVLRHHVLRNAAIPVVTLVGMDVGLAFAGTVFVETVFGLPGMGRTVVRALTQRDLPLILGVMLVVTTAIVTFNIIVDLLYAALDPRVRVADRSHDFGDSPPARKPSARRAVAASSSP